jgi:hypothetical protein
MLASVAGMARHREERRNNAALGTVSPWAFACAVTGGALLAPPR